VKWLERLFNKDKIPSTVTLDGIDAWLIAASNSLFPGLDANADRVYREIDAVREALLKKTSMLKNAVPQEDTPVPAQIRKLGLANRDKMVKQLNSLAEKIVIPDGTDYKTVLSFYNSTITSLESFSGRSAKHAYYVRSLFPDEVNEVLAEVNHLKTALKQLIAPIRGKKDRIMNLEQVPVIASRMQDLKAKIVQEKADLSEKKEAISALKSEIEEKKRRLSLIEKSEEWRRSEELEKTLRTLEEELDSLETDADQLFAPINKVLTLLKKQDETGRCNLSSEERDALSLILESPINALDGDITNLLLSVKNAINEDAALLKDRKRDKSLKCIDQLLETELSAIKKRRELLQSKIERTKLELSEIQILKEHKEVNDSFIESQRRQNSLQEEVERSERYLVSLEAEINEQKILLSKALEGVAGKEVEVEVW